MPRYHLVNSTCPDPVAGFDSIIEARFNARSLAERTKYVSGGVWAVVEDYFATSFDQPLFSFTLKKD